MSHLFRICLFFALSVAGGSVACAQNQVPYRNDGASHETNTSGSPTLGLMPAGHYSSDDHITAKNAGEASFVTVDPDVTTTFRAAQYVLLEPNFFASPNAGQYFLAYIGSGGHAEAPQAESAGLFSKNVDPNADVEAQTFTVTLSPNPTTGTFTIRAEETVRDMTVSDLYGKVVMQVPDGLDATEVKVDITHLASGLYFVQGETKTGQKFLQKLVKD
jgi:hypothetical protein